mmetsp:Transcript_35101/g.80868  ORF Transcript_35101/g.80868 Transcript_35101/m.80868 type:complete len:475 (+) Transcript_35101:80-1504(+)
MGCQKQREMEITRCGTCSTLNLSFHIDIAQSTPGEHLLVVGSHEGLGAWNPEKAVRLTTDERTYPVWRSQQIELRCEPEESSTVLVLKYKYVLDRRELKQGFLWEENIPDREVQIPWSQGCDGSVWLIRDSAFNREAATKVTKLAPGAKLLRSPQQEPSDGPISVPEETPEAEEPTETPFFDAKYALLGRRPFAKGGFSSVWRCRRRGSSLPVEFAAKRIDLAGLHMKGKRCIFGHGVQPGEIRLHQNLHHPNIVELIDTFHDDDSKMVSLVLEFCKGGDLLEVMSRHREKNSKGLRESATRRAMKHTFQALAYLHEQGVVHRDVKCENVFKVEAPNTTALEDCTYKLGDFGLAACVMPDEVLMDQVGSPSTSAPEVVRGRPYGKPADIWSAGAAIYTLLAGRRPFEASSYMQMVKVMSKVEVSFADSAWSKTSKAALDLLGELLQEAPDKRPTAANVLKHAWCQREHRTCTTS